MKTSEKAMAWAKRADKVGMPDLAKALRRWARKERAFCIQQEKVRTK